MQPTLSFRILCVTVLATVSLFLSITASSQVWTFRNGFGQDGATNGLADFGRAVCTDASGNVYITGKISDDLTANTVSFGGAALVSAGDDDGFVAKFNSAGVHQWSLRFGGTLLDEGGYGIATDGTSVYVVGEANGAMTVGTSPTSYPSIGGGIDGFGTKLDAATGATVSWVTRFGGGNSDRAQAVCLDPAGNIYVSGVFRTRTANPTATFGSFSATVEGNTTSYTSDLFAAALNSSGTFLWVSTGGAAGVNDNINGSGICYVPSLAEVIVTGSFRAAATTTATYSTTVPVSSVSLTHSTTSGVSVNNEDFCLLEINAANGAFVSGSGVGAATGNEAGLGITYDASTTDVYFAGYFSSSSTTFPGNPANTNPTAATDNILYGRYNPSTNAYTWVKDADNGTSTLAADVARAIASNSTGSIFIAGNFRNSVTFPGGAALTASGTQSDVFVAKIDPATGNATWATQGVGTSAAADDIAYGIATASGSNAWIIGQYASSITLAPLAALASQGGKEDVLLAKFNDPPPAVVTSVTVPPNSTYGIGTQLNFTVNWSEAVNVTGTPFISITIGSTVVNATYVSGSGTTALLFRYTVACNDFDNNGITVGTLNLNGGTIKNTAAPTVNANVTLNNIGSTASVNVSALAPVVNAPTVAQPTCATPTGTIVVNATGNGTLEYSIDNGSSYQASNTFSGLAPGNYNIVVKFFSFICSTAYSNNPVVINPAPSVAVNAPGVTQPTCATPTGIIVVNATGSGTLEYSIDGGSNYFGTNTFAGLSPGSYNIFVRLQSDHACTSSYSSNPVVITAATGCGQPSTTTLTSSPNPSCLGSTVTFTATVISGGNPVTTGTVTFTEGASVLAGNVVLNVSGQATFTTNSLTAISHSILATYSGATGFLTSSGSVTHVVNPIPIAPIAIAENSGIANDGTICAGASVTLTAPGGSAGYSWSTGATSQIIIVTPGTTTTYSVLLTNGFGCSNTVSATITVNPIPILRQTYNGVQVTANNDGVDDVGSFSVCSSTSDNIFLTEITDLLNITPISKVKVEQIITPINVTINTAANGIYPITAIGPIPLDKTATVINPAIGGTVEIKRRAFYDANDNSLLDAGECVGDWIVYTITVNPPPTIICPANITVNNDPNQCGAVVTYAATASNYCGTTISYSPASGSFFPVGTTTVTATATDANNNAASCTFTVTVVDAQNPSITCPANITTNNDANQCGAVVTYAATASDNCPGVSVSYSPASGSFFPVGATTVTATATDAAGHTASCTFTVTVVDAQNPSITCPANITRNNDANQCGAVVTYAATASDNCPGVSVGYSPASGSFFPVGTTTVTATATDAAGHTANCTFTVTVVDAQNPSITCPANITQNNDANQCGAVVTYAATASDNCPGVSVGYSPASGSFFPVGTTTVTATATDAVGRTASCTFTVTVVDNQGPTLTCPGPVTVQCSGDVPGPNPALVTGVSDNCPGAVNVTWVSDVISNQTCAHKYTITRTYKATDQANNSSTCTQIITVNDNTPPTFTLIPDYSVGCANAVPTAGQNEFVAYNDNCSATLTGGATDVITNQTCANRYTITRTYTVSDECGNSTSHSLIITVNDQTAPSLTCPAPVTVSCPSQVPAPNTASVTGVSDNCGGTVTVTHQGDVISNQTAAGYTITRTYRATDVCGNFAECTQIITVNDGVAPTITCPANITVNNDANQCGAVVTYAATATDNCGGTPGITYSPASGSFFPKGTTTVTATATDAAGNTSSCTFTVTVVDAQNPTIACPANITKNNDANQCGAVVSFVATASDNCPGVSVGYSPSSGSFFPVGTTTVTATATDAAGRTSTCTFTVTVVDAQNPTITCPANITVNNATGLCGANVSFAATASDNCPGTIVTYTKAPGSFFNVGTTTVTATATDAAGRTATCTFTVKVVDTQAPTLTCPANATYTITSGCSKKLTPPQPTVVDNCGLSKLTWCLTGANSGNSPSSGINYVGNITFNAGVTTITYTAKDIYGNTSECSFTVSVLETVLPNITCPPNKTVGTDYGYCYWSHVNLGTPSVSDNCGVLCVTNNAPDTFQLGTTIVTWTVTDNSGNTRSCNQTITVLDKQTPSVTCPANIYQDASAICITTVTAPDPTYYDNCTVAKLTWQMTGATTGSSPSTGINFVGTKNYNVGTTTITYTIKDAANNSWSCSFAVTITDKTKPTITCPANIVLPATAGVCNRSIAVPDPTYSDNCGVTKLTWYTAGATNIGSPTSGINKIGTKTFNVGVTTVTYTAYDPWGNSKQCTFTITVTDNQPPVLSCPADRTLCKVSNNTYSIPAMTRTDNCSIATTTYQVTGVTTRSGSGTNASGTFNLGLSTITWTVTDVNGNTSTCSTNVTIVPAGGCRLVSNDPKEDPKATETKAPSKGKLDLIVENSKLEVNAYPNPTENYFNVRVSSQSKETVELKMYDGLGKVVEQKRGAPDQTYRFGDGKAGGIYILEARQGKEKVVIKIFKL